MLQRSHNRVVLGSSIQKALNFAVKCILKSDQSFIKILPRKNYAPRVALPMSDTAGNTCVQVYTYLFIQHNVKSVRLVNCSFHLVRCKVRVAGYVLIMKISSHFDSGVIGLLVSFINIPSRFISLII